MCEWGRDARTHQWEKQCKRMQINQLVWIHFSLLFSIYYYYCSTIIILVTQFNSQRNHYQFAKHLTEYLENYFLLSFSDHLFGSTTYKLFATLFDHLLVQVQIIFIVCKISKAHPICKHTEQINKVAVSILV